MKSVALTLRLEESLYSRAKEAATAHKTSFTAFVQSALAEVLKREEQKSLYDAFSMVGQDDDVSDVAFGLHAQREVIDGHE
jgi:hypothetical protein